MEKDSFHSIRRLAVNNGYYSNVFKKTERLVTTIFFVLSHIPKNTETEYYLKTVTEKAEVVFNDVVTSLSFYEYEAREKIFTLQQGLVSLEGSLRIVNAAGFLADEALGLFTEEIDLVQRYLRNHFAKEAPLSMQEEPEEKSVEKNVEKRPKNPVARSQRVVIPKGDISSDAHLVYSQLVDRTVRIKTVLEAKSEATIKDIAEIITDVGEKTIQRDLNNMIEKGQVVRQGERRWSKYSLAS